MMGHDTFRRRGLSILLSLCVLAGAAGFLCACNTTAGISQDLGSVRYAVTGSVGQSSI
jgi:predicted small secreted protein